MEFFLRNTYQKEIIQGEHFSSIDLQDIKVIEDAEKNVIAYICYDKKNKNHWYIEMFEVVEKSKGLGTQIILWLFKEYNLKSISGEILVDWDMVSYKFWESLGSEISMSEDEAFDMVDGVHFLLERNKLFS